MRVQAVRCPSTILSAAFPWDLLNLCPHDPNPPTAPPATASSSFAGTWTVLPGGKTPQKCWSHFTTPPCFEHSRFTPVFSSVKLLFSNMACLPWKQKFWLELFANNMGEIFVFLWGNNRAALKQKKPLQDSTPQHYRQHYTSQDSFVYLQATNIISHLVASWFMPWEVFNLMYL